MWEKIVGRILGRPSGGEEKKLRVQRRRNLRERYERTMEVITLAEAGAHDLARDVLIAAELEHKKILMVSKEDHFAPYALDYAFQLARRLGYDLVVMNVCTASVTRRKAESARKDNRNMTFQERASRAAEPLMEEAARLGVRCVHVVGFGALSGAIEDVNCKIKRIELVITTPEIAQGEISHRVTTPVFAMSRIGWQPL